MEASEVNQYLEQVRSELFHHYRELTSDGKSVTAEMIKTHYLGEDKELTTLKALFEYHNLKCSHSLCAATLSHYKTTQKYLLAFVEKEYKLKDLPLDQLNHSFIICFEAFLRSYRPKHYQQIMSNNGAMKHIQRLRKMVTIAVNVEWIGKNPFTKFKVRMEKKERDFLSAGELKKIENYSSNMERLQVVKDLYVFSCYTGIAYCDIMELREDQVVIKIDNDYWVIKKRQKTNNSVRLPLLAAAMRIIEKNKNYPRREQDKLLPKLSNQKLNSYLKEIADVCGIMKHLTFHMARHTFATTVTLSNGVPIETVSKILGHTRLATTQIYARVLDQKISEDMIDLRRKLKE